MFRTIALSTFRQIVLYLLLTAALLQICACSPSDTPLDEPVSSSEAEVSLSDEELYQALFSLDEKVSISIDISDEELKKIEDDYNRYSGMGSKSPIYRRADSVTFTILGKDYTIEDVGVRMKGNLTRTNFFSGGNIYNIIHMRLSFDETFDDEHYGEDAVVWESEELRDERKERTFATLDGLEIKWNSTYDNTLVRERYAFEIYRRAGALAQSTGLAHVHLADTDYGTMKIYEPVDKRFIERWLPEDDWGGDLYKISWKNDIPATYLLNSDYGIENEDKGEFYVYDLKTNKKTSNHESFLNLLDVINSVWVTEESFESVVDKDYLVGFLAAGWLTGNNDDMRYACANHYIYFRKSDGKAIFIPYDYDRGMGLTFDYDPSGNGMTGYSPYTTDSVSVTGSQQNPLVLKTIVDGGWYVQQYHDLIAEIINEGWLTTDKFESMFKIAESTYSHCVMPKSGIANVDYNRVFFSMEEKDQDTGKVNRNNMTIAEYFERICSTFEEKGDDFVGDELLVELPTDMLKINSAYNGVRGEWTWPVGDFNRIGDEITVTIDLSTLEGVPSEDQLGYVRLDCYHDIDEYETHLWGLEVTSVELHKGDEILEIGGTGDYALTTFIDFGCYLMNIDFSDFSPVSTVGELMQYEMVVKINVVYHRAIN